MKKVVLSFAALALLTVSCGPSVCDCVELGGKMAEEMKEIDMTAEDAQDKTKEIQDKYKSEIEACEKMSEDMSDEEKEKAAKAAEDCK